MSENTITPEPGARFVEPNPEDASSLEEPTRARSSRRKRSDWRLGGRAIRKWDLALLSVAFLGLGAGLIAAVIIARNGAEWAPQVSELALWLGMLAPVAIALFRARPPVLFRLRAIDLLWGVGFGLLLRLVQGWIGDANGTSFPSVSFASAGEFLRWTTNLLPAAIAAPVIEELFFRGVILVGVYQLFRRSVGGFSAAITAVLFSSGTFVILHAALGSINLNEAIQFLILGATCSLLVVLTGRIWAAVLAHVVYNLSYALLLLIGAILS